MEALEIFAQKSSTGNAVIDPLIVGKGIPHHGVFTAVPDFREAHQHRHLSAECGKYVSVEQPELGEGESTGIEGL